MYSACLTIILSLKIVHKRIERTATYYLLTHNSAMMKNRKTTEKRQLQANTDILPMTNPEPGDVIIPIMGYSGAGKSTFINTLVGTDIAVTSAGMERCTTQVEAFVVRCPKDQSKRLVIVDTISADPTNLGMDDSIAFKRVTDWLKASYPPDVKFSGVVYLHSIKDCRLNSASKNRLDMINRLCNERSLTGPILATTKWDEVVEKTVAVDHESDLRRNHCKEMITGGSSYCRYENSYESAWGIINIILIKLEWATLTSNILRMKDQIGDTEEGLIIKCVLEQMLKLQKEKRITDEQLLEALRKLEVSDPSIPRTIQNLLTRLRSWISSLYTSDAASIVSYCSNDSGYAERMSVNSSTEGLIDHADVPVDSNRQCGDVSDAGDGTGAGRTTVGPTLS
ncbi:hypothetical protein BDQ17DRAFT_1430217 [Cyathus striatus]|nr:hypothetical protein BDQ17DRAFT_1430217 [Cyathus striatus]